MNETNYRITLSQVGLAMLLVMLFNCRQKEAPLNDDWAITGFVKVDSVNPVLVPGNREFDCPVLKKPVKWEVKDVFNPAAVVRDSNIFLLFRAEDSIGKYAGTSRIGLAMGAIDGMHFLKRRKPVLYPDNDAMKIYEWEGGIEDPRVVEAPGGRYIMTYTAYDGKTARLMIATSDNLTKWTKHGPALQEKYKDSWSKSGAIVSRRVDEKVVALKIDEKYWMYFGDTDLFIATSEDLIHWTALEEDGKLKSVMRPRPGYFDSRLVESGPFALATEKGIILIYNGMNLDEGGDITLAKGAYSAGQALFYLNDPTRLRARLEKNFLTPDRPYEIDGQVHHVCFVEGMVPFRGKWFLFYGTADSRIALAIAPMK